MTGVNTLPVHTYTQSHLFLILSLSHALQSPPVKRVLLAFCFTSYSAQCAHTRPCVPQCEGVTDPDGDGFIITRRSLLFLLLFHCGFYCYVRTMNRKQGCKETERQHMSGTKHDSNNFRVMLLDL